MENETLKQILDQLRQDFPDYTIIAYNNKEAIIQEFPIMDCELTKTLKEIKEILHTRMR